MIAGVAVKILLNYLLIGTPGIDIHGGPYASIACYFIVMVLNTVFVCKYAELKFDWLNWIVRPGAAAAVMGIAVWAMKSVLPAHSVVTVAEIAAGIAVFAAAAWLLKAVSREDINAVRRRKKAS